MDAVSDALPGWTIAETIERTSDPDHLIASASAPGRQNIALWERLCRGELAATGCLDTPMAPPVVIDPQNFHALEWSGPPSTILIGVSGSQVEVFNARVFPVLRAPNAPSHLQGLSLTEAFRRYVIGDPEV